MDGIQAALRILSLEPARTDGAEGVGAALDVLRARPMKRSESLKKARQVRARLAQGRDSPKVKKKLDQYNKTIIRKRDKLESLCGKVKTVRLKVSEYKKWTPTAFSQGLLHSEFREHVGDSGRKPNAAHSRHSSKCVAEEKEQSASPGDKRSGRPL